MKAVHQRPAAARLGAGAAPRQAATRTAPTIGARQVPRYATLPVGDANSPLERESDAAARRQAGAAAAGSAAPVGAAPSPIASAAGLSGAPLDAATQTAMESRLGAGLAPVRV